MADDEVKEILDDTEGLLKKITHKICDILIGSSRKKMEKICSDPDIIVHYRDRKKHSIAREKNE
jgi:hypothetical protein